MKWLRLAWALPVLLGCDVRTPVQDTPTFNDGVGALLSDACGPCHSGATAEGGYRVTTLGEAPSASALAAGYIESIECLPDGASPVEATADARILVAIGDATHAGLFGGDCDAGACSATVTAVLGAWVLDGAPSSRGRMHPVGFADPRSDEFHAGVLRDERWARVLDPMAEGACGRCHAGAPIRTEGTGTVQRAPSCTSCHTEPDGVFACTTCHGDEGRAYPPRDPCFYPGEGDTAGAHAAHSPRFDCSVCHGARDIEALIVGDVHGNSRVELDFDPAIAGATASFDGARRTCTNDCHTRGGERETPVWGRDELPYDCNGCHTSPPASHYLGPCTNCHREPNADGTALTPGPMHVNGMVDLGNGSGTCGACHGTGDDPNPLTGSHRAHVSPSLTTAIGCEECHTVPSDPLDPGHLDDTTPGADVVFGARASARGATPTRGADGSCSNVACHGFGLTGGFHTTPRWGATDGLAASCGACHAAPPGPPHTESETCASLICHGSEIAYSPSGPRISEAGRAVHIDGMLVVP